MTRTIKSEFRRDAWVSTYFTRQADGLTNERTYIEYGMLSNSYDDSFRFAVLIDGNIIRAAGINDANYHDLWAFFSEKLAN